MPTTNFIGYSKENLKIRKGVPSLPSIRYSPLLFFPFPYISLPLPFPSLPISHLPLEVGPI